MVNVTNEGCIAGMSLVRISLPSKHLLSPGDLEHVGHARHKSHVGYVDHASLASHAHNGRIANDANNKSQINLAHNIAHSSYTVYSGHEGHRI